MWQADARVHRIQEVSKLSSQEKSAALCPLSVRERGAKWGETEQGESRGFFCFVVPSWPVWYGVAAGIALITQRSVVQIHPPQPNAYY
jgi:hypothetical protein